MGGYLAQTWMSPVFPLLIFNSAVLPLWAQTRGRSRPATSERHIHINEHGIEHNTCWVSAKAKEASVLAAYRTLIQLARLPPTPSLKQMNTCSVCLMEAVCWIIVWTWHSWHEFASPQPNIRPAEWYLSWKSTSCSREKGSIVLQQGLRAMTITSDAFWVKLKASSKLSWLTLSTSSAGGFMHQRNFPFWMKRCTPLATLSWYPEALC